MTMPPAFWSWTKWKDRGSPGALPPDVRRYYLARGWNKAPLTWQARYLLHKGGVIHIPTPPTPPASIFSGKGLFTTGNASSASGHPCAWVAIQMDPEGDHNPPQNPAQLCYWQARPTQQIVDQANAKRIPYIGQAESQPELERIIGTRYKGGGTQPLEVTVPKAIVGNPTSWDEEGFDEAARQGYRLILEWYWNAMPWQTQPDARGYPHFVNVCFGIYDAASEHPGQGRQLPLSAYTAVWHGSYSVWTAEYMTPGDWQEFTK